PVLARDSTLPSGFPSNAGLLTVPGVPSTAQSGGRPRVQRGHPLPSARTFHAERLCLLGIHDALTGVEGGRSGGGNGLARRCRSWRVGRESQRWSGSGSGGSGGNGSRDSNRSERKTGKGWSLEKEIRSSSSSSFYPSRSWWWKT
ncbi:hypothetical protein WN51_02921, partial [Melipona quadrifasciata]